MARDRRRELAQELRALLRDLAGTANAAGYSWAAIGKALGVSRAAARERFSPGHQRAAGRERRARRIGSTSILAPRQRCSSVQLRPQILGYVDVVTADLAEWNQNPELLDWLASL